MSKNARGHGTSVAPAGLAAAGLLLSGCAPSLAVMPGLGQTSWNKTDAMRGPAVQMMVNHVTCQLISDFRANRRTNPAWQKLAKYHFVAAVGLNLLVMDNESVGPSGSHVTPLLADGFRIKPIVLNPPTGSPTSATFNRTLAIGANLTGAQTNNPTLSYQLDMQRLAAAALSAEKIMQSNRAKVEAGDMNDPEVGEAAWEYLMGQSAGDDLRAAVSWCDAKPGDEGPLSATGRFLRGDLLTGDLGIRETIESGLGTLDAVQSYNIYGSAGPTNPNDVGVQFGSANDLSPAAVAKLQSQLRAAAALAGAGGGGGGGGANKGGGGGLGGGGATASSSFASVVTFTVSAGANVGETWTALLWKGGLGGGGGGGSSGGSSGGGGGGPLSASRTATDTLTVTYAPTCKANVRVTLDNIVTQVIPSDLAEGDATFTFHITPPASLRLSRPMLTPLEGSFTIQAGPGALKAGPIPSFTGSVSLTDKNGLPFGTGSVQWTYYKTAHGFAYSGVVSSLLGQAILGTIRIEPSLVQEPGETPSYGLVGSITDDAITKLQPANATHSFWDTIPGCDVTAQPYIENVVGAAAAKTDALTLQSKLQ